MCYTYISGGSLFIVSHAALQVKREVVTADQDPLPKLLLKLTHIRLNAREIQFLWNNLQKKNFKGLTKQMTLIR